MTQKYTFPTLCTMIFCCALLTSIASVAQDCTADVSYVDAVPMEDSPHWVIQFQVEVADCRWSSGSFDFEFTIEDPANDSVQKLMRSEAWTENNTSSFVIEHTAPVSEGEFIGEVTVLADTVLCTCRE